MSATEDRSSSSKSTAALDTATDKHGNTQTDEKTDRQDMGQKAET